jgi:hypothetical protein
MGGRLGEAMVCQWNLCWLGLIWNSENWQKVEYSCCAYMLMAQQKKLRAELGFPPASFPILAVYIHGARCAVHSFQPPSPALIVLWFETN